VNQQPTRRNNIMSSDQQITVAHRAVFDLAARIADYLSDYEGTGCALTFGQIAEGVGIDLRSLSKIDGWIFFIAAESAVDFRQWTKISEQGEPSRFTKKPTTTTYRKPIESPVARSRRAAR
jgi:hypothetical protein